ncbi:helix-turn-helix domain-containing protein [Streptomyces sp. NPDC001552]|uniref:helix-turn-helix domain-containing protein n=1 Tax=Streptomyces sp. NPDC001552 TaxID=3364587 RepID=UPI0036C8A9CF
MAIEAGYDLTPNAGGKAQLARDIGMSASAVGRMIDGKTLPMPHQFESIARVLGADVRTLLVSGGVISSHTWPKDVKPDVLSATTQSQPLSPEAAADMWGITEPNIRGMLVGNIEQAIRLQNEADGRREERGEAVGRR